MSSQVIYGSFARQDNDLFSDKDIGIFCDELSEVNNELTILTNEGWSCAVYTYERFQNMADLGLLFVQHIKQDGIVIFDENNKLKAILNKFTPKHTYNAEIGVALELINIIPGIAIDINCIFWALDIVAVAIRNFCIAYFANKKIFVFSTHKLYGMLSKYFSLTDNDYNTLCYLRNAKYIYRNKKFTHADLDKNLSFFLYLNGLLNKLRIKHRFDICTKSNFMDSVKNMILQKKAISKRRIFRI